MPRQSPLPRIVIYMLLFHFFRISVVARAPAFTTEGPVLTLTLKDPDGGSSLQPNLLYSILSQRPPFPKHLPALRSLQAAIGYRPTSNKATIVAPTFVEAVSKIDMGSFQLQCQSSYDLPSRTFRSIVQAIRGSNYATVHFNGNTLVEGKVSYYHLVPYASLSSIRVTPCWNYGQGVDVQLEAVSGGAGRTKLMYQRNVLSCQYQVDENHLIRSELHLVTSKGKIVYQYIAKLKSGSFRVSVDPTKAIDATWVDAGAMGSWVTDIKLPLEGRNSSPQIRIRRFFQF